MSSGALIRYNLRVVVFNNWWLLVFPIAISQFTVFWSIITEKFAPALPAANAETVTPLLAAFLGAHVLSAEYASRVGAILASKPLNIGKVVVLRLAAVLGLVWVLEALSLMAYYLGMGPYNIGLTFLASIPSTLFMAMLAVTFATLLRHPLAGFAVAAVYWAMHLPLGPAINPYLSLRGFSTELAAAGPAEYYLAVDWRISKVLLLAAAIVLYAIHARLVFRLGVPLTARWRRRALAWAGAIVVVYIVSGACAKVAYGYTNRGRLMPSDGGWFRTQFAAFEPVPIAYLFGPAFRRYLGDMPTAWRMKQEDEADMLGDTVQHRKELKDVVDRMPNSIWAPSAADLYSRLAGRRQRTVEGRIAVYQGVVDAYPNSPYVDHALHEKAITFDMANRHDEARAVFEDLLKRRPNTTYRTDALRYLMENERDHNNLAGAEKWAREWLSLAPMYERFSAYAELAAILKARGDSAGAKEQAKKALQEVRAFRDAQREERLPGVKYQHIKWDRDARAAEAKAVEF